MTNKKSSIPHDATFRQFLTHPDVAREFMQLHLPAELREICDLNTLKLESGYLLKTICASILVMFCIV